MSEAKLAVACGESALGLVSHLPSGPGVIAETLIAEIADAIPPLIATFLLTSLRSADAIAQQHAAGRISTLQMVDAVESSELAVLRRLLPHMKLVQVTCCGGILC